MTIGGTPRGLDRPLDLSRVFRHRWFRVLWTAKIFSHGGIWMNSLAAFSASAFWAPCECGCRSGRQERKYADS